MSEEERRKFFVNRIIMIMVPVIAIIVMVAALEYTKKVSNDWTYTESTTATVNYYEVNSNTHGFIFVTTETVRTIFCTYTIDNKEYECAYYVERPYQKGDVVNIKYDPDHISHSIIVE